MADLNIRVEGTRNEINALEVLLIAAGAVENDGDYNKKGDKLSFAVVDTSTIATLAPLINAVRTEVA